MNKDNTRIPKHRSATSDCNFSFCMHFSEARRRCALRKCMYDRKGDDGGYNGIISKLKREASLCRE